MKRRSRLAVVLRMRELAEQRARARLGETLAARHVAAGSLARLQARAASERAWLGLLLGQQSASAADLRAGADSLALAQREISVAAHRLDLTDRAVLDARDALAVASRERDVVERLLDRIEQSERAAAERREIADLAEVAAGQRAWKRLEEVAA